jgi:hypothetical protein
MRTIPVDTENGKLNIPLPNRKHHVARAAYKTILAVLTVVAIGGIVKSGDPLIVPALALLTVSLPGLCYVEHKIRQIDYWTEENRVRRGMLFTAEFLPPMSLIFVVVSVPALLQAYGINPTPTTVALTDLVCVLIVTMGGLFANRVWTLNKLGFER